MVKIRITKKNKIEEYQENEEDHISKTQDRLYDLHKEIQELEQHKVKLQYRIKSYVQRIKSLQGKLKGPTNDELFQYCNHLNDVAKGKYKEK